MFRAILDKIAWWRCERAIMKEFRLEVDRTFRRSEELLKIFEKVDLSGCPPPSGKRVRVPLLYGKEKGQS